MRSMIETVEAYLVNNKLPLFKNEDLMMSFMHAFSDFLHEHYQSETTFERANTWIDMTVDPVEIDLSSLEMGKMTFDPSAVLSNFDSDTYDALVHQFRNKFSYTYIDTMGHGSCQSMDRTYTVHDFEHGLKIFIGIVNELGNVSDRHFKYFKEK